MTRVMVCGSTSEEDIALLVEEGVDAIGLITEVWQPLPCNLPREEARRLAVLVPPFVTAVLVLTAEDPEEVCRLVEYVSPGAVQLHGFNPPEHVALLKARLAVPLIKTLHLDGQRTAGGQDPERCARQYLDAGAAAILLDRYHEGKVGATGQPVDLALAARLREAIAPRPLVLAGGLDPSNVSAAVAEVRPYAVDVFSGVTREGRLDRGRVRAFVRAVKSARP
ncbi:MAG: phosphoribosylanthranilate isomerase [Clostridia bacterium]|nr:phosphoribosylanthranilate isomerase [Clostridia bacterium]